MVGSVEVSIAVWWRYISLKLFWRTLENEVRTPVSHLLPTILQNFCNFSVLKQVFSICTNFHNDWLKTWPGIRYLVFLLGNLPQFWKFVKETSQIKCKNWHNFRSRFDYDLRGFLNIVFWKVFHLWCAVPLQDFSSDVNEVIRAVLNCLFYFFYKKILHAPKAPKAPNAQKHRTLQVNKNKKCA